MQQYSLSKRKDHGTLRWKNENLCLASSSPDPIHCLPISAYFVVVMLFRPALSVGFMLIMLFATFPATVLADGASPPGEETPVEKMRRLLKEAQDTNRELDRREGKNPGVDISEQPDADPRMRAWKREYEEAKQKWELAKEALGNDFERLRNPDLVDPANTCWQKIQSYYRDIARVYKDWRAPMPSRKGTFITRVDFDIHTRASTDGRREERIKPLADNFVITQRSGEAPQDSSAYAEAQRKASDLPYPPECAAPSIRIYHLFIVQYS